MLVASDPQAILAELDLRAAAFAVPVAGGDAVGFHEDDLVTPASVMKVQVALTVENAIVAGRVDGCARRSISPAARTPGPVGISLLRDEVSMSVRDLAVAMLTISDSATADELIGVGGPRRACAEVRNRMGRQLIHARMASGFGSSVTVAAQKRPARGNTS